MGWDFRDINGSSKQTDTTIPGTRVPNGYDEITASTNANPAYPTSITVTGDGVNKMRIKAYVAVMETNGAAGAQMRFHIEEDGVTIQSSFSHTSGNNRQQGPRLVETVVDPFTGPKTFRTYTSVSLGTPTFHANSAYPSWIEATWERSAVAADNPSPTPVIAAQSKNDTSHFQHSGAGGTHVDGPTITVTGDGVRALWIETWGDVSMSSAGGPRIRVGTTILQDGYTDIGRIPFMQRYYQVPYTGDKTFKLSLFKSGGGTSTIFGLTGNQHGISATWVPVE